MALSAPTLSALIKSKLLASSPAARDNADMVALCTSIAEAVVEHLAAAAVVTFPTAAINVVGTAAAQANAAPCTGGTIA